MYTPSCLRFDARETVSLVFVLRRSSASIDVAGSGRFELRPYDQYDSHPALGPTAAKA